MVFDPFGRLGRHFPEEKIFRLIRFLMVAILAGFLVHRFYLYPQYAVKPLWLAETLIFAVLIIAFLLRSSPRVRSRGVREIVIPLFGSALPFALLLSPPSPAVVTNRFLLGGILWGMTAATSLTMLGLWSLRRSFSITVEARALVTTGPYRFIRHPMYTAMITMALGTALVNTRLSSVIGVALIAWSYVVKIGIEEVWMAEQFSAAHEEWRRHSWKLLPPLY